MYVISAEGAVSPQPGATPQDAEDPKTPSAESAIHFRHGKSSARLRRAFSAGLPLERDPGALPQATDEAAPLALNRNWGAAPG
jgi:hypothetical protein